MIDPENCPIHPNYQAKHRPRVSNQKNCTCWEIWYDLHPEEVPDS